MKKISTITFIVLVLCIILAHLYYPKWTKEKTEATISWDASGYYMYLPAVFIYKDIRNCSFQDEILAKYSPTPNFQQAFKHEKSGNYVMKYPMGQALQFSPFFFIAHMWASNSTEYPPDGFSHPYQIMISIGSLFIAFLGLLFLLKSLNVYFSDTTSSISALLIVLGTNYLNYAAIDGAMTHNTLFTLYCILIYMSIKFYKSPDLKNAMFIGIIVGLAALTRPTEIISFLIPVLWGVNLSSRQSINRRVAFIKENLGKFTLAVIFCLLVGSFQLMYWKYATGEWIVYSYQDQGFSWLSPHLWDGFFSYRSGWLTYTPIMIFALIGFYFLFRRDKKIFSPVLVFSVLFIYITFAWDIWWYGGSLGQRAMVQSYPVLAFPFAAFIDASYKFHRVLKWFLYVTIAAFVYISLWFTHQAHLGAQLYVGQMTKEYYWKVLGSFEKDIKDLKLLDTDEFYEGERLEVTTVFENNKDTIRLNPNNQFSDKYSFKIDDKYDYLRASAHFSFYEKEWSHWQMTQMIVRFFNENDEVKGNMIRVQRQMVGTKNKRVYIDVEIPQTDYTYAELSFWNGNSQKPIEIKELKVEAYKAE